MFFLYRLFYFLVLLVLLPLEYFKRPGDVRSRWLRERFGLVAAPPSGAQPPVWVHAVSVGEVIAAVPLIRELKTRYPSVPVVLSTVTDTGQKVARERVADIARVVYFPFDLVHVVRRLLRRVRPFLFIAVETELWPVIFRTFRQEGIPVLVLNGRLSDNSFRGYLRIRFFIRQVLECVDLFCMQEPLYAERMRALGAEEGRVMVTGNFKFDTRPSGRLPEWTGLLGHPVVLAGSTHEGEEELMVSVFERMTDFCPEMNLVLAPRHPERFRKVEEMVKAKGLPCIMRSELAPPSGEGGGRSADRGRLEGVILILDAMGELASSYGVADVAVMGGSFYKTGGHNPLEPAFWAKPVVCGPHMENFPFIQDFYIGSGAIKTDDSGLYEVIRELLRSPAKRKAMGERAKALYDEKTGAVAKTADLLKGYLDAHLPASEEKPLP